MTTRFIDFDSPVALVAHDAGATNLILAWVGTQAETVYRPVMQGPAAKLWASLFAGSSTLASAEEAIRGATVLLSGTGWASDLEHDARRQARSSGIYNVAVLDHWVNYPERFVRHGETVWPDEFWVTDSYALTEAQRSFPGHKILVKPNLYLEQMLRKIGMPRAPATVGEVLYVLEPIRAEWGMQKRAGEFQALDYFVANMHKLGMDNDAKIRLRPHPSDPTGKYVAWIQQNPHINASIDNADSLAAAIARADWVVGCESYAMAVAVAAERKVASTLPPWAPACRLPHREIVHLGALHGSP